MSECTPTFYVTREGDDIISRGGMKLGRVTSHAEKDLFTWTDINGTHYTALKLECGDITTWENIEQ